MMDEAVPESGLQRFRNSKVAYPIGVILALALGVALFYMGIYGFACGLGFILIAAAVFIVVKWFNGKGVKKMAIFGVLFLIVMLLSSIFVMSVPTMDSKSDVSAANGNGFSDIAIGYDDSGNITSVSVTYTGEMTEQNTLYFHLDQASIMFTSYRVLDRNESKEMELKVQEGTNTYTWNGTLSLDNHTLYGFFFKNVKTDAADKEKKETVATSNIALVIKTMEQGDKISLALNSNLVSVITVTLLFAVIVFFSERASKNMEKIRAQMEAEGRLYPKGYGRCKQCGTVVLPGETNCRKCGAFIEVPEEYRKNLSEYFECSECGAQIPADSAFCPKCGAKFDEEDETVVVKDDAVNTQQTAEETPVEDRPAENKEEEKKE